MVEHTVKAFDDEIGRLRGLIAEMGGLAEVAIANAIEALVEHDDEKGKAVVAADVKLDALEAEVDRLAVRIIALRAPMADDLRDVIAALKISGVVERIGDYAKNIAKRDGQVEGRAYRRDARVAARTGALGCATAIRGGRLPRDGEEDDERIVLVVREPEDSGPWLRGGVGIERHGAASITPRASSWRRAKLPALCVLLPPPS